MSNIVSAKINMLIYLNHIQIIYSLHFKLRQIFYLTPSINFGHDHNICVLIFCWFFLSKYTGCSKKYWLQNFYAFKCAFSVPLGHFRGLPNILGVPALKSAAAKSHYRSFTYFYSILIYRIALLYSKSDIYSNS